MLYDPLSYREHLKCCMILPRTSWMFYYLYYLLKHFKCINYLTENISFCQKLWGIRNLPSPCSTPCFSCGWHNGDDDCYIGYCILLHWILDIGRMMMKTAISDMDDLPSFGSHWRHYTVSQRIESKPRVLLTSSSFRTSLGLEYQSSPQDLWLKFGLCLIGIGMGMGLV